MQEHKLIIKTNRKELTSLVSFSELICMYQPNKKSDQDTHREREVALSDVVVPDRDQSL